MKSRSFCGGVRPAAKMFSMLLSFRMALFAFICLTTLLLQPHELQPATIIVDEPELGLHPYAITIFS